MNASDERAARHARQGIQAATRTFCEIRLRSANATEARQAVDEALLRVDRGSAPQPFKDAVRAELSRRLEFTCPVGKDEPPPPRAA